MENQKEVVANIQFQKDLAVDVFGTIDNFYNGTLIDLNDNTVVREINHKDVEELLIENDKNITKIFKEISYILKICAVGKKNGKTYFGYEYYQYSLRKQIELNKGKVDSGVLRKLLMDLFKGIAFIHDKGFTINNISCENIAICSEDNEKKSKIFNFTMAKIDLDCTKDINDLGFLLLSIMKNCSSESPLESANIIKNQDNLKLGIKYICNIVQQQEWIQPKHVKLFGHLVYCLLKAENCNNDVISIFLNHPYFWESGEIYRYIEMLNIRNPTEKKNGQTKFLGKETHLLNEVLKKYETWQNDLHVEIEKTLRKGYLKVISELIRLMRNKETHLYEESKELQDFCKTSNGFINYFLDKNPDLLYDLFMYHDRAKLTDANLTKYYSNYFLCNVDDSFFDDNDRIANVVPIVVDNIPLAILDPKISSMTHNAAGPSNHPDPNASQRNVNIAFKYKHEIPKYNKTTEKIESSKKNSKKK